MFWAFQRLLKLFESTVVYYVGRKAYIEIFSLFTLFELSQLSIPIEFYVK